MLLHFFPFIYPNDDATKRQRSMSSTIKPLSSFEVRGFVIFLYAVKTLCC